jgi:hypothetical protein
MNTAPIPQQNSQPSTQLATIPPQNGAHGMSIFTDAIAFEHAQRVAKAFASSEMVPKVYQNNIPNCLVAMDVANTAGLGLMTVFQNMVMIQGKPSWSSSFIVSAINTCGKFDSNGLDFEMETGDMETVEYTWTEWVGNQKSKKTGKVTIRNDSCFAIATKRNGRKCKGSTITVKMAVQEGWYTKDGSKWPTMTEQMLQYRAAAFFGRLYCPEVMNGMHSDDEMRDMITVESTVIESKPLTDAAKSAEIMNEKINKKKKAAEAQKTETKTEAKSEPEAHSDTSDQKPEPDKKESGNEHTNSDSNASGNVHF